MIIIIIIIIMYMKYMYIIMCVCIIIFIKFLLVLLIDCLLMFPSIWLLSSAPQQSYHWPIGGKHCNEEEEGGRGEERKLLVGR